MSIFKVEGIYRRGFCLVKQAYNDHCQHKWCFKYYGVETDRKYAIFDESEGEL